MKKSFALLVILSLFSCKQPKLMVEQEVLEIENNEAIDLAENYVNEIESYIYQINLSTNNCDSIYFDELKTLKKANKFTKNTTEKDVIFRNKKIVKVKVKDYLENNFIKVKSFYYNNDYLVGVRIYELYPSSEGEPKLYTRALYYQNNKILADSDEMDHKYQNAELGSYGVNKLQEEYHQAKLHD